jgi:hypothetical protein
LSNLGDDILDLLARQQSDWPMARDGYAALKGLRTRPLALSDFDVRLQFNPARIVSSGAKVDAKSVAARPCFLCPANLPREQEAVAFDGRWQVLVNPFPILPQHFTVPTRDHAPQSIDAALGAMLRLSSSLGERFVVLYNGPRCGASAPDHLHLQIGNAGFLPIESQLDELSSRFGERVDDGLVAIHSPPRRLLLIEAVDHSRAEDLFRRAVDALPRDDDHEPMMNVLCWSRPAGLRLALVPRAKHRPSCYFAEGDERMLISPGAVDVGGVIVLPVQHDFERLTSADLEAVLAEVFLDEATFARVVSRLR